MDLGAIVDRVLFSREGSIPSYATKIEENKNMSELEELTGSNDKIIQIPVTGMDEDGNEIDGFLNFGVSGRWASIKVISENGKASYKAVLKRTVKLK